MVQFPGPPTPPVFPDPLRERRRHRKDGLAIRLDIKQGMQVLVIGSELEQFTVKAARATGLAGQVFVVTTDQAAVKQLEARLHQTVLDILSASVAPPDELPLPDASVDRALLVTVLNGIADKQRALAEVRRVLKSDGLLGVDQRLFGRGFLRRKTVTRWCAKAGFEHVMSYGNPLHYLLVFRLTS